MPVAFQRAVCIIDDSLCSIPQTVLHTNTLWTDSPVCTDERSSFACSNVVYLPITVKYTLGAKGPDWREVFLANGKSQPHESPILATPTDHPLLLPDQRYIQNHTFPLGFSDSLVFFFFFHLFFSHTEPRHRTESS